MLFEVQKNIKNSLFQSHPKFESLSRILCLNFAALYIVGKERFHKNNNVYYFQICSGICRCKTWVRFSESTREIPKSRSKFSKNAIFDLFFLPVEISFSVVQLLDGFYWEYLDASKMLSAFLALSLKIPIFWGKKAIF